MTDTSDWSPVQVEKKILEIVNRIAKSVKVCDEYYRLFLAADLDYDRGFAKAYLDFDGPQTEKKQAAVLATAELRDIRDAADASYRYARDLRQSLDSELEAYRSVGASIREVYRNAGVGER